MQPFFGRRRGDALRTGRLGFSSGQPRLVVAGFVPGLRFCDVEDIPGVRFGVVVVFLGVRAMRAQNLVDRVVPLGTANMPLGPPRPGAEIVHTSGGRAIVYRRGIERAEQFPPAGG